MRGILQGNQILVNACNIGSYWVFVSGMIEMILLNAMSCSLKSYELRRKK